MSRLIDADALLKFVEDRYEITWESDTYEGGIKDACSDIIEKIDNMPTIEPEPHWIPCSERLPIDAGHYLCSFEEPKRIDRIRVDLAYWMGGRWYGYMADAICAWMPLPEPYEVKK